MLCVYFLFPVALLKLVKLQSSSGYDIQVYDAVYSYQRFMKW
jgi:hypothetical protein